MRHLRMVGLALVAVFAMTAIAATSASALPEFGQCYVQAKHEGKYANSNCTTKAKKISEKFTGEFEWRKATEVAKRKFTGAGGAGILTTTLNFCVRGDQFVNPACEGQEVNIGPLRVECTSENAAGEITGSKTIGNIVVKFHGCTLNGGSPCSNSSIEGEIVVNVLKGSIGYISKSKKEVGVLLTPTTTRGEFAKFVCAGGALTTIVGEGPSKVGTVTLNCAYPETHCGGDGIISPVTPVNTMTPTLTQVYTVNAAEENVPSHFEGKPIELLEDWVYNNGEPERRSAWSKAGEEVTNVNTGEEEVEIKA
jgi:hypothetical protein